jgi:uncharacterized OsmC-like protein
VSTRTDHIADAIERLEAALARSSRFGTGTVRSVTSNVDGLRCTTEEGHWSVDSDLSSALGGDGGAPTPTTLLRAALGSCMAMTYRLRAAKHGIELTSVRVTVETDAAVAGMLLLDATTPAGFTGVRYHVEIESPAAAADVLDVLDEGDRLSPLLDVFTRANAVRRTVSITVGH